MEYGPLEFRKRNLPHWSSEGCTYFITFRLATHPLSADERQLVAAHIQAGNERFYRLAAAVVMPDHVHLLLRPLPGYDLSRIMKGIKGVSARLVNRSRQTTGQIWQNESWDRIVRDSAEFDEKLRSMADNPIKAGLAKSLDDYVGWCCNGESN